MKSFIDLIFLLRSNMNRKTSIDDEAALLYDIKKRCNEAKPASWSSRFAIQNFERMRLV